MQVMNLDHHQESGFALVTVLVAMLILVFLGVAAMLTTTTEREISSIEKVHKDTFYQADNGTSLAAEMLEQNLNCPAGFTPPAVDDDVVVQGQLRVLGNTHTPTTGNSGNSLDFWLNANVAVATDANRDMYYAPYDPEKIRRQYHHTTNPNGIHTNITVGGNTVMAKGSALQMAAGYEGKGKGEAAGGAHINYQIFSEHHGLANSRSLLWLQWRHVVGTEGTCNY